MRNTANDIYAVKTKTGVSFVAAKSTQSAVGAVPGAVWAKFIIESSDPPKTIAFFTRAVAAQ